ncbi:hypothetical protein AtubIFM56815_002954 [Aspergillus tubingensis]|jgi:hypothetical protein|uniref:Jacalin-type lectin domain-containing protein n=3 Tax=Aspergillus subgen. Circumdati TaxID=2720871 RepID=A0A1L9N6F1_ASPTC|nr:similar to An13g01660 [Aspergillus tubingensis]OJI84831.1 hypothetical protein ASPTUDRAFT_925818 [Aspergillus tubingensis CBS 134.48]GAQ35794.1 similar to An13g01660 [Aspergillus niger]GFN14137.1 similar to An13g01660 [Aspergillus tubingensis]GLA65071.1 hypothetical protein AtubIFM54640_006810 [Aspergillus tubingensis]GLA88500.1 hypothetical protein AtubIFM56815_002954 [Aspergillus tubingensis]
MSTLGLHKDGPFGGAGGSAYDARDGEQKVKHVDLWTADYNGYDVIGAFNLEFQDGYSTGRIGGRDNAVPLYGPYPYDFADDETITEMVVNAGNGEGYVNGIRFSTTRQKDAYNVGGHEGHDFVLDGDDLGANGEWAGATGGDDIHGADAVVDSMCLYFKE